MGGALPIFVISLIYKAPNLGTDKESAPGGSQPAGAAQRQPPRVVPPLAWLEALGRCPRRPRSEANREHPAAAGVRSGAVNRALAAYDFGGSAAVAKKKNYSGARPPTRSSPHRTTSGGRHSCS